MSPKINGLDGTIGLAPVQSITELQDYSFLYNLNETIFSTDGVYIEAMNYDVKKFNWGLYEGALLFWSSADDITGV